MSSDKCENTPASPGTILHVVPAYPVAASSSAISRETSFGNHLPQSSPPSSEVAEHGTNKNVNFGKPPKLKNRVHSALRRGTGQSVSECQSTDFRRAVRHLYTGKLWTACGFKLASKTSKKACECVTLCACVHARVRGARERARAHALAACARQVRRGRVRVCVQGCVRARLCACAGVSASARARACTRAHARARAISFYVQGSGLHPCHGKGNAPPN